MTVFSNDGLPRPGVVVTVALGLVALGTLAIDLTRLWLLVIPFSAWWACYGAGTLIEQAAGCRNLFEQRLPLSLAIRIGTGLASLSFVAVLGALAGQFWVAGLLVVSMAAVGLGRSVQIVHAGGRTKWMEELRWSDVLSGACAGVVLLIGWLWATIPPTFYDELAYHLMIPERALATGSLPTYPWMFLTLMPHLSDLWLAWGMALGGSLGARAMHWSIWALCLLAGWALLESVCASARLRWGAFFVTAAVASSPTFWFLGTLPFSETGLTFAVLSALMVVTAQVTGPARWLTLGLALGLACTVKLSGLTWAAGCLLIAILLRWPWSAVAKATTVMAIIVAPWWTRAFLETGNPIYPMGYALFGGRPWSEMSEALLKGDLPAPIFELGWSAALRLPWDLIRRPELFGSASDVGWLPVLATLVVLMLPLVCRVVSVDSVHRWRLDVAALFAGLTGVAWLTTSTTVRFFAPGFFFSLIVVIACAFALGSHAPRVLAGILLMAACLGTVSFLNQHQAVFGAWRVALGREDREEFLARQVPYYEAARFVQTHVPDSARLLFIGEARPYYFSREAVAPYPMDTHPLAAWVESAPTTEALVRRLGEEGITHIVLNVREFRRLHSRYHLLEFSGEHADGHAQRLLNLPNALTQLFAKNGVYVFAVPRTT